MASTNASRPRFCIVSDLDHTMVDHHDPNFASLLEFNRTWASKFAHDSFLVFSTGRSLVKYNELRQEAPLLTPDLLICSVGTEIYHTTETGLELDDEWLRKLDEGWGREKIVSIVREQFPDLHLQAESEQRPHKVSYNIRNLDKQAGAKCVEQLRSELAKAQLTVKVVHSGGIDVDVLPSCASKGLALQFLQARWKAQGVLPTDGIQVNGDSGNDAELYEAPDVYGCVVGNAMQELLDATAALKSDRIYLAKERCAAGILETMSHFGKIPEDSALPAAARVCQLVVKLHDFRTKWVSGTVGNSQDVLDSEVAARLAASAKVVAANGNMLGKSAFVADHPGKHDSAPKPDAGQGVMRSWLDRVSAHDMGNAWFVTYEVWVQNPGEAKRGPAYHSAVVVPDSGSPEGFVIKHLQGTDLKA